MTVRYNPAEERGSALEKRLFWLFASLALVLGALFRFYYIHRIGFRGDDTLFYLSILSGNAEPVYRPFRELAFALYGGVNALFPHSDWAVKGFNALLDLGNVLLIGLIAYLIRSRLLLAALVAFSYAVSMCAVAFSRTELLHCLQTTVLLFAIYLFLLALRTEKENHRWLLLALSGMMVGAGFGVHEEAIFSFLAFGLFFLLQRGLPLNVWIQGGIKIVLVQLIWMSLAFVATISLLGFWTIFASHLGQVTIDTGAVQDRVALFTYYREIYRGALLLNSSWLFFALFNLILLFGALVLILHRLPVVFNKMANRHGHWHVPLVLLPLLVIVVQLLAYPLASPHIIFPRLFLPLLPLFLLSFFILLDSLLDVMVRDQFKPWVLSGVALLLFVGNGFNGFSTTSEMARQIPEKSQRLFKNYGPITIPLDWQNRLLFSGYPISGYRLVADILGQRVDAEHRLLVAPHVISAHQGRRGFELYYGEDAIYLTDCRDTLDEYMLRHRIGFLVVAAFHHAHRQIAAPCLGLSETNYSVQEELATLGRLVGQHFRLTELHREAGFVLFRVEPLI